MNSPIVELEEICVRFGGVTAVDGVTISVAAGEVLGIIGPNGSGKTTLLNVLTGTVTPDSGRLRVEGQPGRFSALERMTSEYRFARTFQSVRICPTMSVRDTVALGTHRTFGWRDALIPGRFSRAERSSRAAVAEVLDLLSIAHLAGAPAGDLSCGDQRRVEIARAVVSRPKLLCLDEPVAGMNPSESAALVDLLVQIRQLFDFPIVVIEHDMSFLTRIADRVIALDAGKKIADAPASEVLRDPRVQEAYLGKKRGADATPVSEVLRDPMVREAYLGRKRGIDLAPASKVLRDRMVRERNSTKSEAPTTSDALLEIENLSVKYGKHTAVHNVSITVRRGEIVALVGANGAGKSTLLRTISGLHRASRGDIRFAGRSIAGAKPHVVVERGICHVPEGRKVFPDFDLRENLRIGAYSRGDQREVEGDVEATLAENAILQRRERSRAGMLSGGEQQILVLQRALMARPSLLLLDEPTLGLAPILASQVLDMIPELVDRGITVVLVEQTAIHALEISDWTYVMVAGQIVRKGRSVDLLADRDFGQQFLAGSSG